jgi:hypothetical protein
MKIVPIRRLETDGLLFEINRTVLHPLGLALAMVWDGDDTSVEPDRVELLQTDDKDGIVFASDAFLDGERKLAEFMAREGDDVHRTRRAVLRFLVQDSADQGSNTSILPPPLDPV